ncbi:efflux RND transporter permease subunit [Amorphus sp. 3PC139-8]|uniref:efflux RND transporter permease subunit n=1 Tax=Amorphus sp. 3PC139-8 TaxID=2735676 RepID=UPI00345CF65B
MTDRIAGLEAGADDYLIKPFEFASRSVREYTDRSRQYPVVLQARDDGRDNVEDLSEIFVRADDGGLVPLSGFVTVGEEASPPALNRFDRIPSVEIGADLAEGTGMGEAIAFVREAAAELPAGATLAFDGEAATFIETSSGTQTTFILALLIVFLVLAAQFESFVHPFVILVTVPLALTGAFGTVPLVAASGAGAASRIAIGLVICGGFAFASVLTLFVTPVVYELLARPFASRGERSVGTGPAAVGATGGD